ncbi:MAG TPA: hypothetical protein VGQ53_08635 [Chitinophagaceae bacterium]|jgi:hypothetical protein|nr:hypothetical protein [Chitinophagaceae bacterium]
MPKIIVEQGNPLSLKVEYIQSFLDELKLELSSNGIDVELNETEFEGLGVTWYEVLRVYLNDVPKELQDFVVFKILELGTKWANKRLKTVWNRPKSISVIDDQGVRIRHLDIPAKKAEEMVDEWDYFYKVDYSRTIDGETIEEPSFYTLNDKAITFDHAKALIEKNLIVSKRPFTLIEVKLLNQISREEYKAKMSN